MENAIDVVEQLAFDFLGKAADRIDLLPQSGSDRRYFRLFSDEHRYIATYNQHVFENNAFIYYSRHFRSKALRVPEILFVNEPVTAYVQEDLGSVSLLNILEREGYTEQVKELFMRSLHELARLQVLGNQGIDYQKAITAKEFGKQAIISDLLYFKYYFLDTLQEPYDKQAILDDFEALATYLTHTEYKFFMFRDFQSRNIMIRDGQPWFIDYQGGMYGAPHYDAASMIWQARANLPEDWKAELVERYMDMLEEIIGDNIDRALFLNQYYGYTLIRILQVLGAYGFRGLFERKAQFLTSIPQALNNLKYFVHQRPIAIHVPEFKRLLARLVENDIISRFQPPVASPDNPMTVYLNSFSYKDNGYPGDESDNGGGFVFDCRGILNPGRQDAYKPLTGLDKEVMDYLEQKTRMPNFLNSAWDMVDITVADYLSRGFTRLMVNFGCTGGQHRSVYAAEQTAGHLRNKFKVKTVVTHLNREKWPVWQGMEEC